MKTLRYWGAVFAGTLLVGLRCEAQAPTCTQLSGEQKQTLLKYIARKYKVSTAIELSLKHENLVGNTCYRELIFQGKTEIRTWELTLFASPDLRFLSSDLLDTMRDPQEEERTRNYEIMNGLTKGSVAARGPANARVAIAVFSDFQCPFCRKFANTLEETLTAETGDVRVIFHHLPLVGHTWARAAAEGAACAQLQSSEAFWAIHDELFRNQEHITPENIKNKLDEFAIKTAGLDLKRFQECIANSMSLGLVLKDLNLAEANQVNGTPTVFINGIRVQGIENAARLRELIAEARKEARSAAQTTAKTPVPDASSGRQ